MKRLQAVQNAAASLVSGAHRRDHAMPLLCNLHWLPVGEWVSFNTAVLVWKCIHGIAQVYLQELCTQVDSIRGRPRPRSASTGCIQLSRVQTSVAQRSFAYNGPAVWNTLPSTLPDSGVSLHTFKRRLKAYLFAAWWTPSGTVVAFLWVWRRYIRLLTYLLTFLQNAVNQISSLVTANRLTLNSFITEFLLIGLSKQLCQNPQLLSWHHWLCSKPCFIFGEHLTFSDQISSVSKSCYCHIRHLRCVRPYLDSKAAPTIATSIVYFKPDNCNSLYHNFPESQITRLQQIQNSLAHAVVKAPKCSHITPILWEWLKITECIEYNLLSLTYRVPTTTQLSYLHNLITVPPPCNTRFSSLVTLTRPSTSSSLRITDRSFQYTSLHLWNQLLASH